MIWPTLKAVRLSLLEFSEALRKKHHFVQLTSGKWTRTLGPPENAVHVRGNIWRVKPAEEHMIAADVKVGDVVEFEPGCKVFVVSVEDNYTDHEPDPYKTDLALYGRSLVFDCIDGEDGSLDSICAVRSIYVRRERQPLIKRWSY